MSESVLCIVEFDGKRLALPDWWLRQRKADDALGGMEPGVLIEDRRVGHPSEARQVISDLHQPGKKAVAVSFCTESVDTPERRKLLRRKRVLEGQIFTVLKLAFDSLIGGKSPKISCKKCGSSLAREYLKSVPCPVCGQEIASARRRERLEVLRSDLTVVDRLLGATPPEPKRTGPVRWLVGGWVERKGGRGVTSREDFWMMLDLAEAGNAEGGTLGPRHWEAVKEYVRELERKAGRPEDGPSPPGAGRGEK